MLVKTALIGVSLLAIGGMGSALRGGETISVPDYHYEMPQGDDFGCRQDEWSINNPLANGRICAPYCYKMATGYTPCPTDFPPGYYPNVTAECSATIGAGGGGVDGFCLVKCFPPGKGPCGPNGTCASGTGMGPYYCTYY